MLKMESTGDGKLRFSTSKPMNIEILTIDGKLFVHSEPLAIKNNVKFLDKDEKEEELDKLINSSK